MKEVFFRSFFFSFFFVQIIGPTRVDFSDMLCILLFYNPFVISVAIFKRYRLTLDLFVISVTILICVIFNLYRLTLDAQPQCK